MNTTNITVTITQFYPHSPHKRRQEQVSLRINDACQAGYAVMQQAGCYLTSEVLGTGHISVCIDYLGVAVAMRVVIDWPRVPAAVEDMLLAFRPECIDEILFSESALSLVLRYCIHSQRAFRGLWRIGDPNPDPKGCAEAIYYYLESVSPREFKPDDDSELLTICMTKQLECVFMRNAFASGQPRCSNQVALHKPLE